jgi:hypothetical protein
METTERIFINKLGEMQIFSPLGDLLFVVEDIDLLTGTELQMLSTMRPDEGEAPVGINMDNVGKWRMRLRKVREKKKRDIWDN